MALQKYVQAQKSSANIYSKLICSHKFPGTTNFLLSVCAHCLRDTVPHCLQCSLVSISPAPKAHHIPSRFTLLSLAERTKLNTVTHAQLRDKSAWTPLQALDETQAREQRSPGHGTQAETPCLLCWNCRKTFPLHAVVPPKLLSSGYCHHSAGGSTCASTAGFALGKFHQDRSTQKLKTVYNKLIGSASCRLPCSQISVGSSLALKSTNW